MLRLYLDFDGVLANSAVECVTSAFTIWETFEASSLHQGKHALDSDLREKVLSIGIENRFLVVPPEHFFCLIEASYEHCKQESQKNFKDAFKFSFEEFCRNTSLSTLERFKALFFQFREQNFATMADLDWVTENPPTRFSQLLFEALSGSDVEVIIVSRKNKMALVKWVAGANYHVDEIFGHEDLMKFEGSKFNLIASLQAAAGLQKAFLIDDMSYEIDTRNWHRLGVTPIEAGWGYNDLPDNTTHALALVQRQLNVITGD